MLINSVPLSRWPMSAHTSLTHGYIHTPAQTYFLKHNVLNGTTTEIFPADELKKSAMQKTIRLLYPKRHPQQETVSKINFSKSCSWFLYSICSLVNKQMGQILKKTNQSKNTTAHWLDNIRMTQWNTCYQKQYGNTWTGESDTHLFTCLSVQKQQQECEEMECSIL